MIRRGLNFFCQNRVPAQSTRESNALVNARKSATFARLLRYELARSRTPASGARG